MYKHNKKYNLNKKAANDTLQNIFASCEVEPNEKSLDRIRTNTIISAITTKTGFIASVILLIVILIMPLAFYQGKSNTSASTQDQKKVSISGHYYSAENNSFVLTISGEGALYDEIYAEREDGTVIVPTSMDEEYGQVYIPYEDGKINIYVPTEYGEVLKTPMSK